MINQIMLFISCTLLPIEDPKNHYILGPFLIWPFNLRIVADNKASFKSIKLKINLVFPYS